MSDGRGNERKTKYYIGAIIISMYDDTITRDKLREILLHAISDSTVGLDWEIARDYSIDDYIELVSNPDDLESFTKDLVEQSIDDVSESAYEIVRDYCESEGCNSQIKALLKDRACCEFVIYDILNRDRNYIVTTLHPEAKQIMAERAYGIYDKRHYREFWGEDCA
jgi:hypothetical protein